MVRLSVRQPRLKPELHEQLAADFPVFLQSNAHRFDISSISQFADEHFIMFRKTKPTVTYGETLKFSGRLNNSLITILFCFVVKALF